MKPINIATDEQWSVIFDGMESAVTTGTAHVAGAGAKYKFAGKTGTAQVVTVKQTESTKHVDTDVRKREHAWFIAFAPADDPKIAISVLVENGGFGASAAAPIARKVLDAFLLGEMPPVPDPKKAPPAAVPQTMPATVLPPTASLY
jgi:penicillin-binding protein 2